MAIAQPRPPAPGVLSRLEGLFIDNVDAVYNVAYRVLWNRADAEDVVQVTFIKAMTRIDQLRDQARVRPWLLQVGYREAISVTRRRRELPTDPTDLPTVASKDQSPAEAAVAADVGRILREAFRALNEDERMAVVLRDVEGLAMREVAEILDLKLSATKMRVARGRASLRRMIANQEVC